MAEDMKVITFKIKNKDLVHSIGLISNNKIFLMKIKTFYK